MKIRGNKALNLALLEIVQPRKGNYRSQMKQMGDKKAAKQRPKKSRTLRKKLFLHTKTASKLQSRLNKQDEHLPTVKTSFVKVENFTAVNNVHNWFAMK